MPGAHTVVAAVLLVVAVITGVVAMGHKEPPTQPSPGGAAAAAATDTLASSAVRVTDPDEMAAVVAAGLVGITHPGQILRPAGPPGGKVSAEAIGLDINDGCNTGHGTVSVTGKATLKTDGFAVTRMACPGASGAASMAFHTVVADGAGLWLDGTTYWISRDGAALQFAPLNGK
nr:META domain-containing protein [Corynebacterium mendelii]